MTFAQPIWFWALLLVPVLGGLYLFAERRSKQMIARIVAPRLRNELAAGVSYAKRRLRTALMLLGLAALVVAMARPQWGYEWQEAKLKGRDVIVAVDVSKSMLANDLTPNRLTRARLATQDLLEVLEGDRLGLVAFAGSAFLQAPLTVDYGAVLTATQELDTDLIPRGGTNLASAIQTALEAFGKGEGGERALILFTDGEELDADGLRAAEKAKEAGVKIFTVGVGSPEGSVIPMERRGGGTDFVRDRSNEIVKSKLDEGRLREIAEKTGGFYSRLEGASTIEHIVKDGIKGLEETESETKMSRKAIDRYQWPLAVGIGLLMIASMIGDRRRRAVPNVAAKNAAPKKMAGAALAIAAALCLFDSSARASEEAESLYSAGKYKEALEAYEKSAPGAKPGVLGALSKLEPRAAELDFDIGAAAYKSKEYDKAMESFSQVLLSNDEKLREKAYYNLGNTLFQKGVGKKTNEEKLPELESALQKYEDALRLNPENADAKHNRDVVAKYIDELKKEQQQQKQDQQKQDQQKQQQQKQDQQKQDQQKQDQQKQDQQKQDQQKQDQQKQDQQKQDQQKQDQQKQDQQKQDQQKQDQQKQDGQKEEQQPKDEPGQTGESKKDQQNQDQPGGGQDKKQEGQGDPKEEQKDGGKGEQEKKQDQAGKEQEKEKSEGEKGENEKKSEEGSQTAKNEPKDQPGSKGDQQKEKNEPGEEKGEKEEPAEAPESADQPREGDLKAADAGEQKDGKESGEVVQAAEESEERKGEGYTKTEARRLLDSLKNEEDRIMLFDKKWREPVYKDW